jgi:hypothetical protein
MIVETAASPNIRDGTMVIVTVAKPTGTRLADWMSRMRDWFDRHRIQPAVFKYNKDGDGGNGSCELSFRDSSSAASFVAEFQPKPSAIYPTPLPSRLSPSRSRPKRGSMPAHSNHHAGPVPK